MLSNRQSAALGSAALTVIPAAGQSLWARLKIQGAAISCTVAEWRRRQRSRHELRALSPYQVRDFCLDPMAAEREITKPFWRACERAGANETRARMRRTHKTRGRFPL